MTFDWQPIQNAFRGWRALLVVAIASATLTAAGMAQLGELWAAPRVAAEADSLARQNAARIQQVSESIRSLERTVRIYICTRGDLDTSTRIRLQCRDFD